MIKIRCIIRSEHRADRSAQIDDGRDLRTTGVREEEDSRERSSHRRDDNKRRASDDNRPQKHSTKVKASSVAAKAILARRGGSLVGLFGVVRVTRPL